MDTAVANVGREPPAMELHEKFKLAAPGPEVLIHESISVQEFALGVQRNLEFSRVAMIKR